jgi:Bacterial extracellular solute-binding proteins, family 3
VDFTPPWLHTSISALKYVAKTKHPELDVTTFSQAAIKGVSVCVRDLNSFPGKTLARMFPKGINLVPCADDGVSAADNCIKMLKTEECMLWVSDELVLLKEQADDPTLEMTGERLQRQLLAWPVRKNLDPTVSFLLNKWMYAAIRNQTISALYFEYFEKKLCPIGTAGKHCELPCDPDHGHANAAGMCICESTKYVGGESLHVRKFPQVKRKID